MKIQQIISVVLVLLLLTGHVYAQENYCKDKASWAEWEQLLQKYPEDTPVKTLYALRIGLCTMVDREQLTVSEAMKIFEIYRQNLLTERRAEQGDNESERVL